MILSTGSSFTLAPWSALPVALGVLAYLWCALGGDTRSARLALPVAWVAHGTGLLAHLLGVGEDFAGARFGFAPALATTAWLVVAVYGVESQFLPLLGVRRLLAALGVGTLALMAIYPGATHLHPTSPWAPLHWLLGLASYGLFGAAVLHAVMLDRAEHALRGQQRDAVSTRSFGRAKPTTAPAALAATGAQPKPASTGLPLLKLEAMTFAFVRAGFVVLSAAIVMGWMFTSAWHWDHKTVFSLLGWCVFAALLMGRHSFGWRGRRATRWVYVGAGLLLLSYAGSRFVFEVLLHRTPL